MRRLTFSGYLKRYVRSLSLNDTSDVRKLAVEAADSNPRLREPLLLYALSIGRETLLMSTVGNGKLHSSYLDVLSRYTWRSMLDALENKDDSVDANYHKVYRSYVSRRNMPETDANSKMLMCDRIKRLQGEKNISTYRIYTDLRLNHSNINAYLKHGDPSKVSLNTARRALEYMEKY